MKIFRVKLQDSITFKNEILYLFNNLTVLGTYINEYDVIGRYKVTTFHVRSYDDYNALLDQFDKHNTTGEKWHTMIIISEMLDSFIAQLTEKF